MDSGAFNHLPYMWVPVVTLLIIGALVGVGFTCVLWWIL